MSGLKAIASPDGIVFDSIRCRERYMRSGLVRRLANAARVGRARLKARTILRAREVYRGIGGRDWLRVKMLLGAVL